MSRDASPGVTAARLSVTYETRFNEAGRAADRTWHLSRRDFGCIFNEPLARRGAARRERRNVDGWIIVSIRVN